jgi:CrcB protein
MSKLLIIAIGGGIGTLARYIVSGLDYKYSSGVFPLSTLIVNLSGSFIIGLLWGFSERFSVTPNLRMFLFIGVLGGYTTFSTLSLETFNLLRNNEYKVALLNMFLTNFIGIILVLTGFIISKYLTNLSALRKLL